MGTAARPAAVTGRCFDEHLNTLAHPIGRALGADLVDQAGDPVDPLGDHVVWHLRAQPGTLGPLLVGVAEDADRVEPGCGEEVGEHVDLSVGLAREAEDDVAADPCIGAHGPDPFDQIEERLRVAEPAHPAQNGRVGVLERQVEVGQDVADAEHGVQQRRTHLCGLQVADPNPVQAVDAAHLRQKGLQIGAEVTAVACGVLADQDGLTDTLFDQPPGLGDDVGRRTGKVGPTEARDRTEGAAPVAAGRDLQGRGRTPAQPPAQDAWAAGRRQPVGQLRVARHGHSGGAGGTARGRDRKQRPAVAGVVRSRPVAGDDAAQPRSDVGVVVEAEDGVRLWQGVGELGAVPLREAADRDHGLRGSRALVVGCGEQGVDRILLGRVDETAGVDQDRCGGRRVVDKGETVRGKAPGQFLRVDLVAGTPEADQVYGDGCAHPATLPHPARRASSTSSRSSGLTSTSRGFEPSDGPTIPRVSRMSISSP